MDKLLEALAEEGIRLQGISEKAARKIAINVGLDPNKFFPRPPAEIVDYTVKKTGKTHKYVKTASFIAGLTKTGKPAKSPGLFFRAEGLDHIIQDLTALRDSLESE